MMVGLNSRVPKRAEYELLVAARDTWLPPLVSDGLSLLVLADCRSHRNQSTPRWVQSRGGVVWRCYTEARTPSGMWRKTFELLRQLADAFGAKQWFVKLDVDTLLRPRPALLYLRYLHGLRREHVYFGSSARANLQLFCWRPRCFFRSPQWRRALESHGWSAAAQREAGAFFGRKRAAGRVAYATGGAYGFSRAVLRRLSGSQCMPAVAAAVGEYAARHVMAHLHEDELVGLWHSIA
jgi:hypothetical protein